MALVANTRRRSLLRRQRDGCIIGGSGGDVFQTGRGADYLFLGSGTDTVVIDSSIGGIAVVNNFDPLHDQIWLAHGYSNYAQVQANIYNYGSFTVLSLGGGSAAWLVGVSQSQISASDFSFHP